jgi:hypothetical protein
MSRIIVYLGYSQLSQSLTRCAAIGRYRHNGSSQSPGRVLDLGRLSLQTLLGIQSECALDVYATAVIGDEIESRRTNRRRRVR